MESGKFRDSCVIWIRRNFLSLAVTCSQVRCFASEGVFLQQDHVCDCHREACGHDVASNGTGVYKGGQTVFRVGDVERSMFFVNRGSVLVVVDGKVVDQFETGHLFGEVGMILGEKRTVTA